MSDLAFLGFVPPWATNWLTSLWLISVGTLIGLAGLLVLWLLAAGLSRIRAVGSLADQPGLRSKVAVGLSVVCFLLFGGLSYGSVAFGGGGLDSGDLAVVTFLLVLLSALVGTGLVYLTSRRTVAEVPGAVREGPLWPIFITAAALAGFSVAGVLVASNPQELLSALKRIPQVGTISRTATIPAADFEALGEAADPPQHSIDIAFRWSELDRLKFYSTENLTVDVERGGEVDIDPIFEIPADDEFDWRKTEESSVIDQEQVERLYVRNYGAEDAEVSVTAVTQPAHPEVWVIPMTAVAVMGVFLLYILQQSAMPRLSAVALSTLKSEMAQPLFLIIMLTGVALLIIFLWVPYNTFGEDIKVLKDSGLTLIMVLCIIQAVWAASTSVSEEIEGRTALTVLSKPITRRSFIIGKFLGITWTVAVMFILLGLVLLIVTAYKPIYDAREATETTATWQLCHLESIGVVPGLTLAFMETLVLAALSVAISTRLPLLANFIICFTVYMMGHLTPLLVQTSAGQFAPIEFVANLLATGLPILEHFNIQAAIAAGISVPYDYLGWSLVYCLMYGMIALLLALLLFEDRDLA